MYTDQNGKLEVKVAFVSTFKEDSNNYKPEADGSKIVLTVKHASLLAIDTLNRLNRISLNMTNPIPLLTPLAGAIFSKDDIRKVANVLGKDTETTINMINASCQSGGQHLPMSSMAIAAIASIVRTRNLKDKEWNYR